MLCVLFGHAKIRDYAHRRLGDSSFTCTICTFPFYCIHVTTTTWITWITRRSNSECVKEGMKILVGFPKWEVATFVYKFGWKGKACAYTAPLLSSISFAANRDDDRLSYFAILFLLFQHIHSCHPMNESADPTSNSNSILHDDPNSTAYKAIGVSLAVASGEYHPHPHPQQQHWI